MLINSIGANYQAGQNFTGAKEGANFRRIANKLIESLRTVSYGDASFEARGSNGNSLRSRLIEAIYTKAGAIGKENVTAEDRRLHGYLKTLYKNHQEEADYVEAMCGGGDRFVDRTIDFTI